MTSRNLTLMEEAKEKESGHKNLLLYPGTLVPSTRRSRAGTGLAWGAGDLEEGRGQAAPCGARAAGRRAHARPGGQGAWRVPAPPAAPRDLLAMVGSARVPVSASAPLRAG